MKEEILAAVTFLIRFIEKSDKFPQDQLENFQKHLTELLMERFEKHWFPELPSRGQAYRCIRINGISPVDLILERAAALCGTSYRDLRLPTELTVWVDPSEVCYRLGESEGSYCTLASFPSIFSSSASSSSSSSISSTSSEESSPASSPPLYPDNYHRRSQLQQQQQKQFNNQFSMATTLPININKFQHQRSNVINNVNNGTNSSPFQLSSLRVKSTRDVNFNNLNRQQNTYNRCEAPPFHANNGPFFGNKNANFNRMYYKNVCRV